MTDDKPPLPPFTHDTAAQKVQAAEDAWNTCDAERVAQAYTIDSVWRNRDVYVTGRDEIITFLTQKWERELDYALRKNLWCRPLPIRVQRPRRPMVAQLWQRAVGIRRARPHASTRSQHQRSGHRRRRSPHFRPPNRCRTRPGAPTPLGACRPGGLGQRAFRMRTVTWSELARLL